MLRVSSFLTNNFILLACRLYSNVLVLGFFPQFLEGESQVLGSALI